MCENIYTAATSALFSRRRLLFLGATASLVPIVQACSNPVPNSPAAPTRSRPITGPDVPSSLPELVAASPAANPPVPLLCRDSWGAREKRSGGRNHVLNRMTLHHSAITLEDNRQITSRLREHQRNHQDQQGWIDIAYHIAVDRRGNLFELRSFDLVGDTATDYDPTGHFLVLLEGNFDQEEVTQEQLNGAAVAFAWAAQAYGISTDTLVGHRDVPAATACPGAHLEAYITDGELKRRVNTLLANGPVKLERTCGPEATAIVANIEAGR